ncbi:hypothetical protein BDN67DRAFT_969230 [Paxillus ammoniavirescens]|nr:hypothetical protein BDN67DRAFT_969230 [Paxillus ammoniavirescens]
MFDEIIGACCGFAITACCDTLSGICIDFISVRHACTETLCDCSCTRHRKIELLDELANEQEPLIPETQQPSSHPPMHRN